MRMGQRPIQSNTVVDAVDTFEIIEAYADDKYLPSYLVRAVAEHGVFHLHVATDVEGDNVRIVTAYVPDPREWDHDFRRRLRVK